MDFRRLRLNALIIVLTVFMILPCFAQNAQAANRNPSLEEISAKFDRIANEKNVPAVILKAIAYEESGWRQWNSSGSVLSSGGSRPNLGIMQVSCSGLDSATLYKIKNDIDYNIAYGADILKSKYEAVPQIGDGDPNKLENWYFALWAYNSWSSRNNPNNAEAAGRVAYQDRVLETIASDYMNGLVKPISITPVPASSLRSGTVPSSNVTWSTPQPVHYAENAKLVAMEAIEGVTRIAGADRIETAIKISQQGWQYGSESVIIVRSDKFPDALAGVALAKKNGAPILLTESDKLDSRVITELKRLKPLSVTILGGEGAISNGVEDEIKEVVSWTQNVQRIAGQDRYETAAMIAESFPEAKSIAIATGNDFPDALSLAAAAAGQGYPLILTAKDSLPEVTLNVLRTKRPELVYIAGGESAVSSAVQEEIRLSAGLSSENITRFAGANRYDTSGMIARSFYPTASKVYIATGQNFPDALAGAALAAKQNSPLLLLTDGDEAENTVGFLRSLANDTAFEVFGGFQTVTNQALLAARKNMSLSSI